ncbi:MAG TPA: hypothetical protein VNU70_14535, partial [Puia sp.]|nr:hypothetical protein [Puia sp.]
RRAKDSGLKVSCSVTPYHLFFTDADLVNYDTNLKVYPPLRDEPSVTALRMGVLDGTVDCIASHHLPHESDSKVVEFEYARPGMTGLETTYAILRTLLPGLSAEKTVDLLSRRPRELFGLALTPIGEGQPVSLSLFDPAGHMRLEESNTRSRSKNSPFMGKELKGRVLGILNGGHSFFNSTTP